MKFKKEYNNYIIIIVVLVVLTFTIMGTIFLLYTNTNKNTNKNTNSQKISGEKKDSDYKYMLKEKDNKIIILDIDKGIIIEEIDVLVSDLPEYDRISLLKGVPVKTQEELRSLIEDYDS
ncbi:MAG: hypothetical protein KFW09_02255 [Oscillospiraceae bacterium]|nr:hypothetical protein [Oscillospiraceae bacterium]